MAKHTMSMYQTKDAMIDAMQADIDSLKAQLEASEFHRSNNLIEISELCAQLAEARKDSERLDYFEYRYLSYTSYYQNERLEHEIEDGHGNIFTGCTIRESIDNVMKGGE